MNKYFFNRKGRQGRQERLFFLYLFSELCDLYEKRSFFIMSENILLPAYLKTTNYFFIKYIL